VSRWQGLSEGEAARLARELLSELAEEHPLHGRAARAVARRIDCDDVAFEIDSSGLCVIHLTWAGKGDMQWPRFELVEQLPEDDE
jgi:hypothetical protein